MSFMGTTEFSKPYAMKYARWTFLFAPFTAGTVCLSQTLRGEGSTVLSMIGMVSGCVINIFLDPLMITVFGWGVAGAAIATGISKMISFTLLLRPYILHKSIISISLKFFKPRKDLYAEIARMGIPVALRTSLLSVSNIIINNLAAGYGDVVLAAVAVANKSMKLVGSAILGLGQGFQPIAGFCWGAKKYNRVKKAFLYTSALGVGLSTLLGVLLFIYARNVLNIFTNDVNMMNVGVILIRSQSIVLPLHVWVIISSGLFQGTGNAVQAGILGLCRQGIALIPCIVILTLVFGLNGLATAQATADVVSFSIALCMILPMMLRLNRLQEAETGN
jgi:putative MATE family efflux protein